MLTADVEPVENTKNVSVTYVYDFVNVPEFRQYQIQNGSCLGYHPFNNISWSLNIKHDNIQSELHWVLFYSILIRFQVQQVSEPTPFIQVHIFDRRRKSLSSVSSEIAIELNSDALTVFYAGFNNYTGYTWDIPCNISSIDFQFLNENNLLASK